MAASPARHRLYQSLTGYQAPTDQQLLGKAETFQKLMQSRRTVRDYSPRSVPDPVIEQCLMAAGSAPSGANQQPWHFAVVKSPQVKQEIRRAAEAEEREFYQRRAPEEWLETLAPLGTDENKPFLEIASHLIVVFTVTQSLRPDGQLQKHYYPTESVGIATGMLITALHQAGLVTLTHTPSPMAFLNQILDRPRQERPFLLLVVGFPGDQAQVPDIGRKPLDEISSWH